MHVAAGKGGRPLLQWINAQGADLTVPARNLKPIGVAAKERDEGDPRPSSKLVLEETSTIELVVKVRGRGSEGARDARSERGESEG